MKKISAIDIGSNSIKQRIYSLDEETSDLNEDKTLRKRIPVRLGKDIYSSKSKIFSDSTINKLGEILSSFEKTIHEQGIKSNRACATAAFRKASNKKQTIDRLKDYSSIDIEIISGIEEIQMVGGLKHPSMESAENFILADVGGGSTDILVKHRNKIIDCATYPIGSVSLNQIKIKKKTWKKMYAWLDKFNKMGIEKVIGVGGGIRGLLGRYEKMSATHDEFELLRRDIIEMDKDERKAFFKIPTDRAELIHHSAYIYSNILRQTGINKISAIPWGLTEAIAYSQVNDTTRK